MSTSPMFTLTNVQYLSIKSRESGTHNPEQRGGVRQADVTCNSCNHQWTARRSGPGKFMQVLQRAIALWCPKCGASGTATPSD